MKNNNIYHAVSVLVLLFAILACAIPGQQAQPDASSMMIETAIAGTAQAASAQTAVVPISTETPTGPTGTTIEQLPDGTTRYTDYDAHFEVTYPAGWLAVRPNSEEFNAALVNQGAGNSMLHDQMAADLSGYEANADRLYAYILHPEIQANVLFGFSKLKWDPADTAMLDNANMGELVRGLETQSFIPGFRVETAQIHDDTDTRVIEIAGRWTLDAGTPDAVPFYSIFYFFKPTQSSTVRITISFVQDYQDELAADVKSIMESIRIIEP
jgi:hypothetical protein